MNYAALFNKYQDASILSRAKDYSNWTLPHVAAINSLNSPVATESEGDFQSDGALLVTTLSAKLAGLLFPTTHPFLRIPLETSVKEAIQNYTTFNLEDIENDCARIENEACSRLFLNSSYSQLINALDSLIVTGNVGIYRDSETSRIVAYGINSLGIKRDNLGRVVDALIRERVLFSTLDESLTSHLIETNPQRWRMPGAESSFNEQTIDLYTRIKLEIRQGVRGYAITQELDGVILDNYGWYRESNCPYFFPVWRLVSGEHYGRGLVESHAGGFATLSELNLALVLYQAEALRLTNLAGPGASNDIDGLIEAEPGEWVQADPNAVKVLETGVIGKVAETQGMIAGVFEKLARAFMYTANTRQAERVTAYELQQQAIEADNALGGPYSTLSDSLQLPLAYLLINEVDPDLMDTLAYLQGGNVAITTGIDALGRATKVQNLLASINEVATISQLLPADRRLDPEKVFDAIFRGRSIDTSEYFKTPEQLQAEIEAESEMAQAQMEGQQAVNMADQAKAMEQFNIG